MGFDLFSSRTKLHGVAALYGPEGSGKTLFLKLQLALPFFEDYDVIIICKKDEWKDFEGKYEDMIDYEQIDVDTIKQLKRLKSKIIVIDGLESLVNEFGSEKKLYSAVKKMSKKNQIIFSARNLPDYPFDYEIIIRVTGVGSKVIVLRNGVRSEYSWESMKDDAIFMMAVLE